MGFFANRKKNKLKKFLKNKNCSDSLNAQIIKQIDDGSISGEYQISKLIADETKKKNKPTVVNESGSTKSETKSQKTEIKSVNKPAVNNYAAMFRAQMESSGGHPSENDSLHSLVEEWEKNFPDDKNLFFAKAILASGNLFISNDKILDLISEGEYAPTMYDSTNYMWFYDTAMSYYRYR